MKRKPTAAQDIPISLGYAGEYRDPVSQGYGLGNGYRTYLPQLMRFAAADSLSPFGPGGVNPYAYVMGDPVNASDPSGHAPQIVTFFRSIFRSKAEGSRADDASIGAAETGTAARQAEGARASSPQAHEHSADPGPAAFRPDPGNPAATSSAARPIERPRARTLPRLESLRREAAWGELADREDLDRAIAEIAPDAAAGEYSSSVKVMNQALKRAHIKLTAKFSDTVINNVKKTTAGEMRHASASMNEVGGLLSEALAPSAPLSPKSRMVFFGGALLNLAAVTAHAQHDLLDHAAGRLDGNDKTLMDAYLANAHSI